MVYQSMADYERGRADYDEKLRLEKQFAGNFYNQGMMRQGEGDIDGAILDYIEFLHFYTENEDVYRRLGDCHYEKDVYRALSFYRTYLEFVGSKNADNYVIERIKIGDYPLTARNSVLYYDYMTNRSQGVAHANTVLFCRRLCL